MTTWSTERDKLMDGALGYDEQSHSRDLLARSLRVSDDLPALAALHAEMHWDDSADWAVDLLDMLELEVFSKLARGARSEQMGRGYEAVSRKLKEARQLVQQHRSFAADEGERREEQGALRAMRERAADQRAYERSVL